MATNSVTFWSDAFTCTEQLYQSAWQDYQEAAARFEQADAELQKLEKSYRQLSDELESLKKLSPEAEQILSNFTPFEDIPSTVSAPLLACVFRYN